MGTVLTFSMGVFLFSFIFLPLLNLITLSIDVFLSSTDTSDSSVVSSKMETLIACVLLSSKVLDLSNVALLF